MDRRIALSLLASAAIGLSGCLDARAGVGMPRAAIYQNVVVPLRVNVDEEKPWETNTSPGLDMATATTHSIVPNIPGVPGGQALSVGWGNMAIDRFVERGELEQVHYADAQHLSILGLYNRLTIRAYGTKRKPQAQ